MSAYRGVTESSWGGTWFAQIKHQGKVKYLGSFKNEKSAALAFDKAALLLRGDRATLNFPLEPTEGSAG